MGLPISLLIFEEDDTMAIIEEVCPKCGGRLRSCMTSAYPSVPVLKCTECGWKWKANVKKVPFYPQRHHGNISMSDDKCNGITMMDDMDGGIFT